LKSILNSLFGFAFISILSFTIVFGTAGYLLAKRRGISLALGIVLGSLLGVAGWCLIAIVDYMRRRSTHSSLIGSSTNPERDESILYPSVDEDLDF